MTLDYSLSIRNSLLEITCERSILSGKMLSRITVSKGEHFAEMPLELVKHPLELVFQDSEMLPTLSINKLWVTMLKCI